MERIAIFPGSFDPITLGHQSIVMRALPLFDKVIIAIGDNTEKRCKYTLEQRMEWIEKTFEGIPNIEVDSYNELTVDYCKRKNAKYIIRGLRNAIDFQYEQNIAQINSELDSEIETVFLLTELRYTNINSSVVREILKFGGDVKKYLPENIREFF
ncbi:MAG: pantetheine-phosphate adenylyltransferase [Bacteroidales bacterium]|jgi:pantetheine-phosphate adenylyltransferase|nr:pantetheine-phosphate adenylyltransferase [Bacteroidales bacterium]